MNKSLLNTLPLLAIMWFCGGPNPEHDTMMAEHDLSRLSGKTQMTADSAKHASMEQMKQATQRFLDMWFSGKTDGIKEIVAENFVTHMEIPGVASIGIQQLKDMIAISAAAFPDNKMEDMHLVADGDRVVAHYQWNGVDTGSMGEGMPANNVNR